MNAANARSLAVPLLSFAVLLLPSHAVQADTEIAAHRSGCSHLRYSAVPIAARDGAQLFASDFNHKGEVVGAVSDESATEAMVWKDGRYVRLGEHIFAGAFLSIALAINDRSQIVGEFVPPDFNTEEYLLDRRGVNYLVGEFFSAREINDHGEVVGLAFSDGQLHGAVWRNGETVVLPMASGHVVAIPFDINNKGTVVGFGAAPESNAEAVVWFAPYMTSPTVIPLPANANSSLSVKGVNDRDQVILEVGLDSDVSRSYVWTADRPLQVLEPLPRFLHSAAQDINRAGLVVGISIAGVVEPVAATLWRGGQACELRDLVTTPGLQGRQWSDASESMSAAKSWHSWLLARRRRLFPASTAALIIAVTSPESAGDSGPAVTSSSGSTNCAQAMHLRLNSNGPSI